MAAGADEKLMDRTPEEYARIKSAFNAALDAHVDDRKAVVEASGLDTGLRSEVHDLLRATNAENDDLERSAFGLLSGSLMPETIGQYRIIREVGSGGMGAVYESIRESEGFTQRAAIKIVRNGLNNAAIVRRFNSERKILAQLEHPNIARFLDGGTTDEGLPFYAMEFVDGVPIDQYCLAPDVSLDQKLTLFRQICAPVSYAHSQLIVHRDLKPSNILVNSEGVPKLLDFGIAKIIEDDGDVEGTGTATQFGMMTPQYASPEQIRGEKVSTLSDVYSLGMILYEIITGDLPYRTDKKNYAEILELVSDTKVTRPSGVISSPSGRSISRISNTDLDRIVLKALQKEPERRYASVEQLSEDLRRFGSGLPVTARADSVGYRFGKFVRRNRVASALAAVVLVSLVAGIAATAWQAYRAEQQRALAEKRFAEVRNLANLVVFKYHDEIAKLDGSTGIREMLVKDASNYLDALAADAGSDSGLKRELALAYVKLGDVQGKLYASNTGNTAGANECYRKAVTLLEDVVAAEPSNAAAKDDLIKANDSLLFFMNRLKTTAAEKKALLDRTAALIRSLAGEDTSDPMRLAQLSMLYIRYGDMLGSLSDRDSLLEKLGHHQKAISFAEKLVSIDPDDPEHLRAYIRAAQRLGTDHFWLGQNAETNGLEQEMRENFASALSYHRKMYGSIEKIATLLPNSPDLRQLQMAGLSSLAESLARNGEFDEAEKAAGECLEHAVETVRTDPQNREAKIDLGLAYTVFGRVYRCENAARKAIMNFEKALAAYEEARTSDPDNVESRIRIAELKKELAALKKV